eukprot:GHVQ01014666.1.p1 GENE.GHVQ01014666.1~~GHVQ01014666.1.p1  ORF type:complete len:204 (+),score=19.36 GHVQ01014666.1:177-788(+)
MSRLLVMCGAVLWSLQTAAILFGRAETNLYHQVTTGSTIQLLNGVPVGGSIKVEGTFTGEKAPASMKLLSAEADVVFTAEVADPLGKMMTIQGTGFVSSPKGHPTGRFILILQRDVKGYTFIYNSYVGDRFRKQSKVVHLGSQIPKYLQFSGAEDVKICTSKKVVAVEISEDEVPKPNEGAAPTAEIGGMETEDKWNKDLLHA